MSNLKPAFEPSINPAATDASNTYHGEQVYLGMRIPSKSHSYPVTSTQIAAGGGCFASKSSAMLGK